MKTDLYSKHLAKIFIGMYDKTWYFDYKQNQVRFSNNWLADLSQDNGTVSLFKYQINSHGFHGKEFYVNPDVVCAGCSVTAGQGLPHEFTWPFLIEQATGYRVNNVSFSGASPELIVYGLFSHIKKFGLPKKIFIVFPNIERIMFPSNNSDHIYWLDLDFLHPLKCYVESGQKPFLYKDFYGKKNKPGVDIGAADFARAFFNLSTLCSLNEIELKVSTWSRSTHNFLIEVLASMPEMASFIHLQEEKYLKDLNGDLMYRDCENNFCEYKNHIVSELGKKLWEKADDGPNGHPGLHYQLHLAENFSKDILNKDFISKIDIGERNEYFGYK